ncbi:hypothetical protein cyc_04037 [Cyclospora cayetanensis]|uniref:Transmembrane protein n=1 Tax=Cyclospora cayetanensis TaxID=88456 RepID=A0A1D3D5Y7_9EIME|nr:hypothetical protein cyc_04037 [Cyclospora cayetanensis]
MYSSATRPALLSGETAAAAAVVLSRARKAEDPKRRRKEGAGSMRDVWGWQQAGHRSKTTNKRELHAREAQGQPLHGSVSRHHPQGAPSHRTVPVARKLRPFSFYSDIAPLNKTPFPLALLFFICFAKLLWALPTKGTRNATRRHLPPFPPPRPPPRNGPPTVLYRKL